MIKKKKERRGPIEIDLTGPDGNVFALMGHARNYAKQIWGRTITPDVESYNQVQEVLGELIDDNSINVAETMGECITNQMMESDYENAVQVFDRYFGSVITLLR